METPQYLRKKLFPMHSSLRLAGLLNPLDAPHHMRADDECPFREGVVLDKAVKKGAGSFVDIGKRKVRPRRTKNRGSIYECCRCSCPMSQDRTMKERGSLLRRHREAEGFAT